MRAVTSSLSFLNPTVSDGPEHALGSRLTATIKIDRYPKPISQRVLVSSASTGLPAFARLKPKKLLFLH
jgi:hypothetical protein